MKGDILDQMGSRAGPSTLEVGRAFTKVLRALTAICAGEQGPQLRRQQHLRRAYQLKQHPPCMEEREAHQLEAAMHIEGAVEVAREA